MEFLLHTVLDCLSGINSGEFIIFIVSMLPVLELRGGLLAASWLGIDAVRAVPICIVGSFLPVPFIIFLIRRIFRLMKRWRPLAALVEKLETQALGKSGQIRQGEFWGLLIFVGVPLPGTGAWTGALIAALLNIRPGKALPAIFGGVLISAAMMAVLSYGILGNIW